MNSQHIFPRTKKIKGRQYARPFVLNDRIYTRILSAISQVEQSNSIYHLQGLQKIIYKAFQIPAKLIGDELNKLGAAGIASAEAAQALKKIVDNYN